MHEPALRKPASLSAPRHVLRRPGRGLVLAERVRMTTKAHVSEKDPRYPMIQITYSDGRVVRYHRTVAEVYADVTHLYQVGSGRKLPFLSFPSHKINVLAHILEPG